MKRFLAVAALSLALTACNTAPAPQTAPNIAGLYQGTLTFTTCYPGQIANLTLEVTTRTDGAFDGKLTAKGVATVLGAYSPSSKTFQFDGTGDALGKITMTLSADAAVKTLTGTYTQNAAAMCSEATSTARGNVGVSKP